MGQRAGRIFPRAADLITLWRAEGCRSRGTGAPTGTVRRQRLDPADDRFVRARADDTAGPAPAPAAFDGPGIAQKGTAELGGSRGHLPGPERGGLAASGCGDGPRSFPG